MKTTVDSRLFPLALRGSTAAWRFWVAPLLAVVLAITTFASVRFIHTLFSPPQLTQRTIGPDVDQNGAMSATGALENTGVAFAIVAAAFIIAIAIVHRKRFLDVTGPWNASVFAAAFGGWLVFSVVASLVDYLVAPHAMQVKVTIVTFRFALVGIPVLAVQTFAEEYLFRGYLLEGLSLAFRRPLPAVIVAGTMFGALHLPNSEHAVSAFGALIFGIGAGFITVRTGSIWATYGMHFANNLFGLLVVVDRADIFSGSPALFTYDAEPYVADCIVSLLGMLCAVVLTWRHRRNELVRMLRGAAYTAAPEVA